MTETERTVLVEVCDYLDALLADCIRQGLPQDMAIDIRMALASARAILASHTH